MKFFLILTIIICASFSLACSRDEATESPQETVVIEDGYKTNAKNEVVFDDQSFADEGGQISISRPTSQEKPKFAYDGSQITTMYDGYGNKTETRFFDNHPLLRNIIVRTSVKGERQIFAFGQNGTVKDLPADMVDKALIASANELATAADFTEGRRESQKPMSVQPNQPPLQPMPSYKFPIQTPPTETTSAETPTVPNPKNENPEPKN